MIDIHTKLRRVGNSFGIVVPAEIINFNRLREGDELQVNIKAKRDTISDMLKEARRQKLRFRRTTKKILDEIDGDSD